jgi:hypothetical protein
MHSTRIYLSISTCAAASFSSVPYFIYLLWHIRDHLCRLSYSCTSLCPPPPPLSLFACKEAGGERRRGLLTACCTLTLLCCAVLCCWYAQVIDPTYVPTDKDIEEYAAFLQLDLDAEPELAWIAQKVPYVSR